MDTSLSEICTAMVVMSPMRDGDDTKNQDRASWHLPANVAALCDGATSSPHAARAAEIVTELAPMIFMGVISERLKAVADLLLLQRFHAQREGVAIPVTMTRGVGLLVRDAIKTRLTSSFQTTLVTVALTPTDDTWAAEVVCCGDSAFFAFEPTSGLMLSCISGGFGPACESMAMDGPMCDILDEPGMRFGPGDGIMARVLGSAASACFESRLPSAVKEKAGDWLVCAPVELAKKAATRSLRNSAGIVPLCFGVGDLLLVPRYLAGTPLCFNDAEYRLIPFSRRLRILTQAGSTTQETGILPKRGNVTYVLPDHIRTGQWTYNHEVFPRDTHFVLASDGFYGCFRDPHQMWAWLQDNREALKYPESRERMCESLHAGLRSAGGDDDVSFVWIHGPEGVACSEEGDISSHAS